MQSDASAAQPTFFYSLRHLCEEGAANDHDSIMTIIIQPL